MALLSPPETISDRGTPRLLSPLCIRQELVFPFDSGGNEVDHTRTCDAAAEWPLAGKREVTPAPINPWTTYFVKRDRQPAGVPVPFFTSDTSTRLRCQHADSGLYSHSIASRLYPHSPSPLLIPPPPKCLSLFPAHPPSSLLTLQPYLRCRRHATHTHYLLRPAHPGWRSSPRRRPARSLHLL